MMVALATKGCTATEIAPTRALWRSRSCLLHGVNVGLVTLAPLTIVVADGVDAVLVRNG